MAERLNAAVLKTVISRDGNRGFESPSLLQSVTLKQYWECLMNRKMCVVQFFAIFYFSTTLFGMQLQKHAPAFDISNIFAQCCLQATDIIPIVLTAGGIWYTNYATSTDGQKIQPGLQVRISNLCENMKNSHIAYKNMAYINFF